ncbi:hypothetical protein TNCV_1863181 [Trichonephila clavipes]|nr:hypothetical protein TNCV_1863181 [Trichonephila clavipes]
MSSFVAYRLPRIGPLILGLRTKSLGKMSREYGGCSKSSHPQRRSSCRTHSAICGHAILPTVLQYGMILQNQVFLNWVTSHALRRYAFYCPECPFTKGYRRESNLKEKKIQEQMIKIYGEVLTGHIEEEVKALQAFSPPSVVQFQRKSCPISAGIYSARVSTTARQPQKLPKYIPCFSLFFVGRDGKESQKREKNPASVQSNLRPSRKILNPDIWRPRYNSDS